MYKKLLEQRIENVGVINHGIISSSTYHDIYIIAKKYFDGQSLNQCGDFVNVENSHLL